jgi:hypothetical protein
MPLGVINTQWLGQNESRSYPIVDWASKQDSTGTITLPNSFIVYLSLPIHSGLLIDPAKFFLKALVISPLGYTVTVGYDDGSASPPDVAVSSIAKATHTEFRYYNLVGVDDFADASGYIIIGRLVDIDLLPAGRYTFEPAATNLEVDTIRPNIRNIASLTVVNGTDRSEPIYGDVEFVAKDNMRISVVEVDGSPTQIVFSAIRGEGLNEDCACDISQTGEPVRFINGIPPGPDGNFRMVGDDCLSIDPIANGLSLSDVCSKPCCGCSELTALREQLIRFADGDATLRAHANNILAATTQLGNILLSNRIGRTCVDG